MFDEIKNYWRTVVVHMNQAQIAFFAPLGDAAYLATQGLNGCTVVVIASPNAGILAHIPPTLGYSRDPRAGIRNVQRMMTQVVALYQRYYTYLIPTVTWVISAVYRGEDALPMHIAEINNTLHRAGL